MPPRLFPYRIIEQLFPLMSLSSFARPAHFDALTRTNSFNVYLHRFGIVIGVLAALFLTKFIAKSGRLKSFILRLSSASFFVFAFHFTPLRILQKISYKIFCPDTSSVIIALYFITPIIIIIISIFIYRGLAVVAPRFTSIITGGR